MQTDSYESSKRYKWLAQGHSQLHALFTKVGYHSNPYIPAYFAPGSKEKQFFSLGYHLSLAAIYLYHFKKHTEWR